MLHAILQKEKGINKRDLGLTHKNMGQFLIVQQDLYLLEERLLRFTSGY